MTSKIRWLVLLALLSIVIIFFFYHDILDHLNNVLFYDLNDGLKNYFNYAFHIKHDESSMEFSGMNYPYGESILMVDCHPSLANLLRFVSRYIVDISDYSIGILNSVMFLSLVVSVVLVFLILNKYQIPNLINLLASLGIVFLSSNAILWTYGHYALSYACFFPIGWYILILFDASSNKFFYSFLFSLISISFFYIHVYLGFILVSFAFFFHLFKWIFDRQMPILPHVFHVCIQVLIPLIVVYSMMVFFDDHEGRIVMPFTTDHRSSLYNIFLPNHSFVKPFIPEMFRASEKDVLSWDNVGSYIGLSTVVVFLGAMIYFLRLLCKKRITEIWYMFTKSQWAFLTSSLILLFYAAAFPFRFDMEFLLPNIIKQFIALGRFAWPFFFVSTIFSFIMLNKIKSKNISRSVMFFAATILLAEGLSTHKYIASKIGSNHNLFTEDSMFTKMNSSVDFDSFQALVPLPFYHGYISLNKFGSTERNKQLTMQLSYNSGLPLMSAALSRPSLIESRKVVDVFLPQYYPKEVLKDMNEKPLLLAFTKDSLNTLEQDLIDKAKLIYENKAMQLYSLAISNLTSNDNSGYVGSFYNQEHNFYFDEKTEFYSNDSITIFYESFDDHISKKIYRGAGALEVNKNEMNLIFTSDGQQLEPCTYNLSFWYYNYLYDQSFNTTWIEVKDKNGEIKYSHYFSPDRSNIYHGNWAFNETTLTIDNETDRLYLFQRGSNLYEDKVYFDELILRPNDQNVYRYYDKNDQRYILKNNEEILVNWVNN